MKCEICQQDKRIRVIAGMDICVDCFEKIQMLRNADHSIISYFANPENFPNASERTKKYIQKIMDSTNESLKNTAEKIAEMERLEEAKKEFLFTTSHNFEGYTIEHYIKIVHAEVVLGTGFLSDLSMSFNDFLGTTSSTMEGKLSLAKQEAETQLLKKTMLCGGNAILGVDYDINTIGNNMIMVSANGTAVKIIKNC